jgi:hypothetical protein
VLEHPARVSSGLQGLREDHVVEGIIRIVGEVGVGVALDNRQPLGDAFVHTFARQLDAAAVHTAAFRKEPQQLAVAAAHIEHLRAGIDHRRNNQEVDTGYGGRTAVEG